MGVAAPDLVRRQGPGEGESGAHGYSMVPMISGDIGGDFGDNFMNLMELGSFTSMNSGEMGISMGYPHSWMV